MGGLYARFLKGCLLVGLGGAGLVVAVAICSPPQATAAMRRALNSVGIQVSGGAYHHVSVDLTFSPETDFTWTLECGTSTSYGSVCRNGGASNGNTEPGASFVVTGLLDATTYHFRVVASDTAGTTTWSTADQTATTLTSAPPIIDFHSYMIDSGHISGFALIDPKGQDTTWYLAAGSDLAHPQTSQTSTLSGEIFDTDQMFWGGDTPLDLQLNSPLPSVLYLQLHASNVKGSSVSPVVTVTIPPTTTTTPTTTTVPFPNEERPTMSSTVLPAGVVGKPYHFQLPVSNGTPPYTVVLNGPAARMPPGLRLESNGVVDGSPQSAGQFVFDIGVYDQQFPQTVGFASVFTLSVPITAQPPQTTTVTATTSASPLTPKLVLPNRTRTPGVVNPHVTQATIKKTICVSGWTAKVQPSVAYTNALKLRQMKQYGEKASPSSYEEDQLIPLQLGGAPTNPRNLWPEPHSQSKHSDPLETSLKRRVCTGKLTLAAARRQIVAYKRTHG